jgi:outer membrane protein
MKKQNNIFLGLLFLGFLYSSNSVAQEKKISLEEAKSIAIEHNKKLKQSKLHVDAATASLSSVKAGAKPTLDGALMGIYLSDPINTLLPEFQANANLAATQVIYAGGKIQNGKKIATSALDIQMSQKELTEDEVLLQVETSYWTIVKLKEKKVLAEKYAYLLNTLHQSLQNAYDAGLTYKNDLLKVEVTQNEAELDIIRLHDAVTMAKHSLAQTMGKPAENIDVEDSIDQNEFYITTTESGAENRPELQILAKAVEMQSLKSQILKGDRRPTVVLGAYGVAAVGKQINFKTRENTMPFFAGMLSVNIPILDWGSRKQKVAEQEFKTEAQKLALTETQELIELQIKDAKLQVNQSVIAIGLAEKSLKQAEENLRLNEDRLYAGTVIGEEVLKAQVLWQGAYSNLIDAKAAYKINEAKYKKAIGAY